MKLGAFDVTIGLAVVLLAVVVVVEEVEGGIVAVLFNGFSVVNFELLSNLVSND